MEAERRARGFDGSILALTGVALALRIYLAAARMDSHWPDEQFQSLEPAGKAVFGYGTLSWEWQTGYRSWFVPLLYIPLFFVMKLFGAEGGSSVILASRVFTAIAATGVLLQMDRLFRKLGISELSRLLALGAFAFSSSMILWSCATLGDTWAMIAVWGVLPSILDRSASSKRRDWVWIGFLAGLPALIKLQLASWILGLGVVFLGSGASLGLIGWAVAGGCIDLLAMGALDWFTWGVPYHSLIEQVGKGNSIARFYGVAPWWAFFPEAWQDQGPLIFLALGALALAGLAVPFARQVLVALWKDRGARKTWMAVVAPALLFLLMLMSIDHKEERFLLPILPVLYFALGLLVEPWVLWLTRGAQRLRWKTAPLAVLAAALAGGATWACTRSLALPLYLTSVDISDLEGAIHDDRGLSPGGDSCVLLINHNWSWTRGQLILGAPVRIVDEKLEKIAPGEFAQCSYAILPNNQETAFVAAAGPGWTRLKQGRIHYALYRRGAASETRSGR